MERSRWLERRREGAANAFQRRAAPAPVADAAYYQRLETGARWLASRTGSEAERCEHLFMADRYARLRVDAAGMGR